MENKEKIILGVKINDLSWQEIKDEVRAMLANKQQRFIFTPNPEICLAANKNKYFKKVLNSASFNIPDGFGLKIGALILGQSMKNRIPGVDFVVKLCQIAEQKNCSIMFIGGWHTVAADAARKMHHQFPNLKIIGDTGLGASRLIDNKLFYDEVENNNLLSRINNFKPDILCVALGAPKQELWMEKNISLLPSVKIATGVGGTFDYISGRISRAPRTVQTLGLEWLFRLIAEPARAKRIINAVLLFPFACARQRFCCFFCYQQSWLPIILNETGKILLIKNKQTQRWEFPTLAEFNSKRLSENLAVSTDNFALIKNHKTTFKEKFSKILKLTFGRKGVEYNVSTLKLLGNSQNL
ncbi:WecB/TagA/CpsF family glycosyltransferase, partial [Candidatus Falkowbacteria bacterium]|nr:WecB/TagA/CpsF family glycosyltransferase [Candidatus Falkowbacteria bacterium]